VDRRDGAGIRKKSRLPVGGHEVDRQQIVGSEAEPAHEVAMTTAQGQAGDPGWPRHTASGGQAEGLRLVIEVPPGGASLSARRLARRINPHALHARQVDHDPAVTDGKARNTVATPAHGYQQFVYTGELDGVDDVGNPGALDDQRRMSVNHPVMDFAGVVVGGIARAE
jgi:hypothetical protein